MKKIILSMVAAISVIIGVYAYPSDSSFRNSVALASFDTILVNAPLNVRVLTSDRFSIQVMGDDSILANSIAYNIDGRVLKINCSKHISGVDDNAKVIITTSNNRLPKVIAGNGYYIADVITRK